jgi:hypothetical protein
VVGHSVGELGHERQVDHRRLVDDDHVGGERLVAVVARQHAAEAQAQ